MKTTKQLFLLCIMALCIQQAFMKKVDKKRKLIEWPAWAQVGGCLGSAGCAAIVMASCSAETIATGPAGIAACAGTLTAAGAAGCKDALMSCSGKRRLAFMKVLEKAKAMERRAMEWPSWAQVGGCLGSAGCAAIVMGSCSAETVAAGPAGVAACGGTLAAAGAAGCTDALKSCSGKRRLAYERKLKQLEKKRKLIEWPSWAQVGGCLGSAGCAAIVMGSCSAETVAAGPAGVAACGGTLAAAGAAGCKDALMSCSGKRRLAFMKVLEKAKGRRALEWPSWAQVGGCLGSAGCAAIVMGSCSAETVAAGPAGVAACGGTLAAAGAAGCKDALMSCSGKRRLLAIMKKHQGVGRPCQSLPC